MSRNAEAVRDELDYWQHVLEDLGDLNRLTLEAAHAVAPLGAEALAVLILTGDEQRQKSSALIMGGTANTLDALGRMQPALDRMIELARGRALSIERELAELRGGGPQ